MNINFNTREDLLQEGFNQVSKTEYNDHEKKFNYTTKTNSERNDSLGDLEIFPLETIINIFGFLSGTERAKIMLVSKDIKQIASDRQFSSSALGSLKKLPAELTNMILHTLPPYTLKQIQPVSSEFKKLAAQVEQPEYAIARKNLEIIRSEIFKLNVAETNTGQFSSTMYLDAEGNLEASGGDNIGVCVRQGNGLVESNIDERSLREHKNFFTLYWAAGSKPVVHDQKYNKFALGVKIYPQIGHIENEIVEKVRQHTVILANQLWDGANEIAKQEEKMYRGILGTGRPLRPHWEAIIEDPANYPLDHILEAGKRVKHIAQKPKPKVMPRKNPRKNPKEKKI